MKSAYRGCANKEREAKFELHLDMLIFFAAHHCLDCCGFSAAFHGKSSGGVTVSGVGQRNARLHPQAVSCFLC